MDSYLDIARTVLRARRRPMGAKAILDAAYRAGVVPPHLYGKTQQKTLQARLSEDILHHRESSVFYRTEPGQFALTEFIDDPDFPDKWKPRFPARRRTRDLKRPDALAVRHAFADALKDCAVTLGEFFARVEDAGAVASMHPDVMKERGYCAIWTFSIVRKDDCVLAYRIGRYRDNRDTFANKRSIGFPGALAAEDVSLFSKDRLGVEDCSVAVLQQDLDLSLAMFDGPTAHRPTAEYVTAVKDMQGVLDLIIVLSWDCPYWFEPTTRRLSLNEPGWLCPSSRPNDMDDFEPWSAQVLRWLANTDERTTFAPAHDHPAAGGLSQV